MAETKYLNPMIAGQLKLILKRKDVHIEVKRIPGVNIYTVVDPMDKILIQCDNAWDSGDYSIDAMGQNVANINYRENDGKPTQEQNAVLEFINAVGKQYEEQEKSKKLMNVMSEEDKALMSMLQQYTSETQK